MMNDARYIQLEVARGLADQSIDQEFAETLAGWIAQSRQQIRGVKVCEQGICLDYFIDEDPWGVLPELTLRQ